MKRLLTASVLALALSSPAFAQRAPDPNQTAQAVGALGRDTSTGLVCYLGTTSTCAMPVSGATGGGGGGNAAASTTGAAVPTSADYTGYNSGGNLVGVSPTTPLPTQDTNSAALLAADQGTQANTARPASYTLTNAATSTGAQTPTPGSYSLTFPTALNGATLTLTTTDPSGNVTTTAYSTIPTTTPQFNIFSGTTVGAAVSGGTPTGSAKLNGGPTSIVAITQALPGIGGMAAVPAGSTNGTAITLPTNSRGLRFYLAAADSVTFTIQTTAPTAAPTSTYTISGASGGTGPNWDESLSSGAVVYVTAKAGAPLYRPN